MNDRAELFLRLSSALTGVKIDSFSRAGGKMSPAKPGDLKPRNTLLDLTAEFLPVIDRDEDVGKQALNDLLSAFRTETAKGSDFSSARKLLSNDRFAPLCRSIMKLWYVGVWYSPKAPGKAKMVVSEQAYKEGLVWQVMQAHPVGFSMSPFGYWSESPPPLDTFVTMNEE